MSGKGKRRREARRRAKQREEGQRPAQEAQAEGGPERRAPPPRAERKAAREEVVHSRTGRKKARGSTGLWQRVSGVPVSGWMIGVPIVVIGAVVVAVLILTSGSSGGSVPKIERTPDPRVAGLTPTASFDIEAGGSTDDAYFRPNTITAKAGDVVEIVLTNSSTVTHNLMVSGPDKEFDTADDFDPLPNGIKSGETGRVVVKIDEPGSYPFHCVFHPTTQKGTLVLE